MICHQGFKRFPSQSIRFQKTLLQIPKHSSNSPHPNSFKSNQTKPKPKLKPHSEPHPPPHLDFTSLDQNTPLHIQLNAFKSYQRCQLSSMNPIIKFSIARKMRLLDLPPHQSQFQSITSKDEINLYNWIDQAFLQLLYLKKLWIPTKDWSETDDRIEEDQRDQNWLILKESFQHQILNPLGFKYGHHLVESNLNQLIQSQFNSNSNSNQHQNQHQHQNLNLNQNEMESFLKPYIIWRTICPEKGEEIIEWMSEKTSDVIWPGLVRLRADQTIARKYWESESRRFSTRFGGVPRGLGKDGEMLEIDEEMGEPCEWVDGPDSDSDHRVEEVMKTAEGILIKEFIEERQLRSKS